MPQHGIALLVIDMDGDGTKMDQASQHAAGTGGRRKLYIGIAVVILIVAGLLLFTQGGHASAPLTAYDNAVVSVSFLSRLNVPSNISNSIGIGTAEYLRVLSKIKNATALSSGGRPEVLYIGADYCPFCAAERWALIIALSRFGSFSNLHYMTSSATDYSPSTPTFTFYNSTYSSPYITFVSVEETTNQPSGAGYVQLQAPTQAQQNLLARYDVNQTIPFVLFANYSYLSGATYDPYSILYAKNWTAIAQELYNTSSAQSQSIMGSADLVTEQICSIDNNTPSSVCSQPYVQSIRRAVGS